MYEAKLIDGKLFGLSLNATPEFMADPKSMKALEKLCKLAYYNEVTKLKSLPNKSERL